MLNKFLVVFTFLICFTSSGLAQEITSIDIVTDEWDSCTLTNFTGLYFDICRAIYEPKGIKLNIKFYPYARTVQMMEKGQAEICIGVYTGDVSNSIYPKWNIDFDDISCIYPKSKVTKFNGVKTMENKKIAWVVDYGYEAYIEIPHQYIEVANLESGLKMLQAGRVDFVLDTKTTIEPALKELKINASDYQLQTLKWIKLYVCFIKNDKGKKLSEIWDQEFSKMMKSGAMKKLFQKWEFTDSFSLYAQ